MGRGKLDVFHRIERAYRAIPTSGDWAASFPVVCLKRDGVPSNVRESLSFSVRGTLVESESGRAAAMRDAAGKWLSICNSSLVSLESRASHA